MRFDHPAPEQIPQLLRLWKEAFGEHDGFWELFLSTGFSPARCRCITENEEIMASLCWFDCSCDGQKQAYVYAVVTHPAHRGRGLCRALLDEVHAHLRSRGYTAVLLVPAEENLRQMYRKLGYTDCTAVTEFSCAAADSPVPVRTVSSEEYTLLRRNLLPQSGVAQEGENLAFLAAQAQLFAGEDFLLAAYADGDTLIGMELLGSREAAPGILRGLGFAQGRFRCPGEDRPFAMVYPLTGDVTIPRYFGFAFD